MIRGHDKASWIKTKIGNDYFNSFLKFTVVRDPYTRAISAYEFQRQAKRYEDRPDILGQNFEDFIRSRKRNTHTQFCKLTDKAGRLMVDEVARFETLKPDLDRIFKLIGLEERLGENRLNTSRKKDTPHYLNATTIKLINEIFAEDFELFGYETLS